MKGTVWVTASCTKLQNTQRLLGEGELNSSTEALSVRARIFSVLGMPVLLMGLFFATMVGSDALTLSRLKATVCTQRYNLCLGLVHTVEHYSSSSCWARNSSTTTPQLFVLSAKRKRVFSGRVSAIPIEREYLPILVCWGSFAIDAASSRA